MAHLCGSMIAWVLVRCRSIALFLALQMFDDSVAGPSPAASSAPISLVTGTVVPCLLAATEDYTTDNRGDVGSWVRNMAMGTLTKLLLLLVRYMQRPSGGGDGGSVSPRGRVPSERLAEVAIKVRRDRGTAPVLL